MHYVDSSSNPVVLTKVTPGQQAWSKDDIYRDAGAEENETNLDVLFVGGGFRTTTFLASDPTILDYDLAVVEGSDELGPGAFRDYTIDSSSAGSGFFRHVQQQGSFAAAMADPVVREVAEAEVPVPLQQVGEALSRLGRLVYQDLDSSQVFLGRRVEIIDVRPGSTMPVTAYLDNETRVRSRMCVLASGRTYPRYPKEMVQKAVAFEHDS